MKTFDVPASILLVDDDLPNLYAMAETLRSLGHELVTASSGEQALRCLLERDFALILMDVRMHGLDGIETAEIIRSRERSRYVPIIFVTGFNMEERHIFRGYSAGAVDYIFKPVDPIILKSKVSVFVELYRKTEEIKRQAALERALLQENFHVRTEKMRADEALRQRDEQYSLVIRSLPIALYSAPPEKAGRTRRFISDNIESIAGFDANAFAADEGLWQSRLHADDRERVIAALAGITERAPVSIEYRWIHADGSERHFLDQAVLVRDQPGPGFKIVGTWLDITDRKQLEAQLHRAQRLEAIGRLTGGIAHDFNNMLSVVIGNLDLLHQRIQGEAGLERFTEVALQGALRCSELTQRLLTFARQQPLHKKLIDLDEFISTTAGMLNGALGQRISIELNSVPNLATVAADPAQMEAAVFNLIFNARDAMPNGGQLVIELANVDWSAAAPGDCAPGQYVMLSIGDTGTGMSPEVMARVFEPFFTTKDVGQGTGLGLSTTYGFVKQSGGHVEIDSRVGHGTTVRLYFPAAAGPIEPDEEQRPAFVAAGAAPAGVEGAILVVEDEPDVREMVIETLGGMGFVTLQATDAPTALEIIDRHDEVDLLLTDIMMPGMNGRELAAEALKRRPDLKILYTSGGSEVGGGDGDQPSDILRKPYRMRDLAAKVCEVLGAERRLPQVAPQS